MKRTLWALIGAVLAASVAPAGAEPIADFYRGKSLRMLIGYGPGGGYDLYARLVAEFLPKHIPGNPTIVPQNMPGAGGNKAAGYVYSVAPRDGTAMGALFPGGVLAPRMTSVCSASRNVWAGASVRAKQW